MDIPAVESVKDGHYRDERDLIQKRAGALLYMLKRFEECRVRYVEDGEEKEVCGRIKFNHTDESNSFIILTGERSVTLSASQIIQIS